MKPEDIEIITKAEQKLLDLLPVEGKDKELKEMLDEFYWCQLEKTPLGDIISNFKVVGGARKVDAAKKAADANNCTLGDIAVVGDSITDFKMLKEVNESGGFAVAFNANKYAVPYATISLASESLNDLRPVLDAWAAEGHRGALTELERLMDVPEDERQFHFHDLSGRTEYDDIVKIHKKYRSLVRGLAASLG